MKVILFGATGMVGQGVLRECLLDSSVETVLAVGRTPTGQLDAKLRELRHDNFFDFAAIEPQLAGIRRLIYQPDPTMVGVPIGALVTDTASQKIMARNIEAARRAKTEPSYKGVSWLAVTASP